jgi:uncharacterized protein YdeI (YjbR/CyaY-like superfamily)
VRVKAEQGAEALLAAGKVRPTGLQIEAAKADSRWAAAYPSASRIEVSDHHAAALDQIPEARPALEALKGGERHWVLYWLH